MKINKLLLTIIILITTIQAFRKTRPNSLTNVPFSRFIQIDKTLENKKQDEEHNKPVLRYNVKITIVAENDGIDDDPFSVESSLELSSNSLNLYQNGKLTNQISYLE